MAPYEDWVLELTLNGATGQEVSEFRRVIEQHNIVSSSVCRKISANSGAPAEQTGNTASLKLPGLMECTVAAMKHIGCTLTERDRLVVKGAYDFISRQLQA